MDDVLPREFGKRAPKFRFGMAGIISALKNVAIYINIIRFKFIYIHHISESRFDFLI